MFLNLIDSSFSLGQWQYLKIRKQYSSNNENKDNKDQKIQVNLFTLI